MEEEGEVSNQDIAMPEQELDLQLSHEQNCQETIRGVRSFMGWHQVLEFKSSASSQHDNPFASLSTQPTGKVPVKLPSNSTSLSMKATLIVVLKL